MPVLALRKKHTVKPWGSESLIVCNEKYAWKEIVMKKGLRSSLQKHTFKYETIYVLSGKIELESRTAKGDVIKKIYRENEGYSLPPGTIHRVTVIEDSRLFEVSTPELDDVIRLEDDFNRK